MVLPDTEPSDGAPKAADTDNGSRPVQVGESEAPFTVTAPVPYVSSGSLRNPFPPIADYAFLSDCENTCLISYAVFCLKKKRPPHAPMPPDVHERSLCAPDDPIQRGGET